jgi:class 3 adenylate cyclase
VGTGNIKRRLTAILAADAVGYSRMMGKDEEDTLRVLSAHRAVIDGIIEFHEGRIVGTAGDSVLAEFASSVEAVRCAVEIQEALKTRNDALPEARRLLFRIGVNLGDVMVKGEDLLGDGVNVAARLESIAEPGGICISSSVYDQIAGKLNLGFVDAGQQALKNISKPVHVYRIAGTRAVAPAAPPRSRRLGTAVGLSGLVAVVVALGVAWQTGWFVPVAGDREQASATSAADAEAKRAEEERRAAEERTRAAAELAQARAEAQAAKRRAEREAAAAAEAKRALEAQRMTEAKARAEAGLAQARAQAEAKAAREAKARQESETKTAHVAQPAPAGVGTSRFDGQWTVTRSCEAFENRPAVAQRFLATASKGEFLVEWGERGQPAYQHLRGKVREDGGLILTGIASPGVKWFTGQQFPVYLEGRFDGERFLLNGTYGRRSCSAVITRAGG